MSMLILGVAIGWIGGPAVGYGLRLQKVCGEKICDPYFYCKDGLCDPCDGPCNSTGHNFQASVCEAECQDYIFDKIKRYITETDLLKATSELQNHIQDKTKHYLTEADSLKATKELQDTIEWLRSLVAGSLALSLIVCLVVTAALGFIWLRYRRQNKEKQNELDLIESKITTVSGMVNNNCKEKLPRLDVSAESNAAAPSVMTTMTPISTGHPCEDATLEYAYDNQGMTPSPVLKDQRNESTF